MQSDPSQTALPVVFLRHTMLLTASEQMDEDMQRWGNKREDTNKTP